MYLYDGEVYELKDGRFMAVIFKVSHDAPNYDSLMEKTLDSKDAAFIWIDDEISRITTGSGVWG